LVCLLPLIFLWLDSPIETMPLVVKVSRSHSYPPHSVGLLWTSDGPIAETST
jgi:hypothetical protein